MTVDFNGTQVPVTVDCGSTTPQAAAVVRTCTFSIATPSANFATDTVSGTYAGGVHASVLIDAVDPRGQHTTATLPLHVASQDNDPPDFQISNIAPPDASDNIPTLTCVLDNLSQACGGNALNSLSKVTNGPNGKSSVSAFLTNVVAGPADAADELGSQAVAFVPDTSTGPSGNIACVADYGSAEIFQPYSGRPTLSPNGPASAYTLDFGLNQVNTGSATCTVVVQDAGFPAGQVAQAKSAQFRIVVTQSSVN